MTLKDRSFIKANIVVVNSPTTRFEIDANSTVSADGTSHSTKGTDSEGRQGASYIGEGGYCGQDDLADNIYGLFDQRPNPAKVFDMRNNFLMGSMGNKDESITRGGGHIHLNVDSIRIKGDGEQLSACGFPRFDSNSTTAKDLNGGSGGYIYINS